MRTFNRIIRLISGTTLFFFVWSFLPAWQIAAWAAEKPKSGVSSQKSGGRQNVDSRTPTTAERFQAAVDEIRENTGQMAAKADNGEDDSAQMNAIRAKKAELNGLAGEIRVELAATEKLLKDKGLPKEILDRHNRFTKHFEDNLRMLKTNLDDVDSAKTRADRKAKIEKARLHLENIMPRKNHKPFNPARLPSRTREIKPVRTSWVDKAMDLLVPSAEAADAPPSSADLAETLETPQTQEIRDLAQKLGGTSVASYEYVRNAFTYEPYAGSTKGATQTLKEKSGNEWDQASLLIALYRASGIPARYVVGTVEIPIDKAINWLGVDDPIMAGTLLLTLGRPTGLVYSGGKITALRTQHVWVRAFIPFLFSRGATSGPGDMWVDIDPSFKGQTITKTLTVTGAPTFDQSAYLSTFRTESPFEFYKSQLQTFLDTNNPGYVPEALAWDYEITPERFGVLIGQPPYIIKSVLSTYSAIPDTYRQKFTLSIIDPTTGDSLLYYTAPMPQVIGKRMTLSYIPATNADEAVIANYGGLYSTPPYLVQLKPEIKIDGVSTVQGNAIGSGQEQSMEFVFDTTIDQGRVENTIIAGGYYAIGLSARSGDTRENILERTNQLASLAGTIDFNDQATLDQKLGEILYLSATVYHQNLDAITKKIAALDHVVDVRDVSEMMYFLSLKVDTIFGMTRRITPAGITGDMDRNLHTVVPVDGDMNRIKPFMQLVGNVSSYLEHSNTEKIYQAEAISAVKGIQLAHDQEITVHTINSYNVSTELSALQLSSELKSDIANAVNAGQEVIVPERNLTLGIWIGVGYIVQDPTNGKGAYLISDGYGGCATAQIFSLEDWGLVSMAEAATQTQNATYRIQICFPGKKNDKGIAQRVCYIIWTFGELQDSTKYDPEGRGRYFYPHDDFVQPLIDFQEHDPETYLSEHVKASDWQSQDNARYMRVSRAALSVIETLMTDFHVENPGLRPKGSGYRTIERNIQLAALKNKRVAVSTSHHLDGTAADMILAEPDDGYNIPEKCVVLQYAREIVGNGETLHEGTATSVHIAKPGFDHVDSGTYSWRCK